MKLNPMDVVGSSNLYEVKRMIEWIMAHWLDMVQIYVGLIGVASIIVKLTPTLKDDTILKTIIRFTGKVLALNR